MLRREDDFEEIEEGEDEEVEWSTFVLRIHKDLRIEVHATDRSVAELMAQELRDKLQDRSVEVPEWEYDEDLAEEEDEPSVLGDQLTHAMSMEDKLKNL